MLSCPIHIISGHLLCWLVHTAPFLVTNIVIVCQIHFIFSHTSVLTCESTLLSCQTMVPSCLNTSCLVWRTCYHVEFTRYLVKFQCYLVQITSYISDIISYSQGILSNCNGIPCTKLLNIFSNIKSKRHLMRYHVKVTWYLVKLFFLLVREYSVILAKSVLLCLSCLHNV